MGVELGIKHDKIESKHDDESLISFFNLNSQSVKEMSKDDKFNEQFSIIGQLDKLSSENEQEAIKTSVKTEKFIDVRFMQQFESELNSDNKLNSSNEHKLSI